MPVRTNIVVERCWECVHWMPVDVCNSCTSTSAQDLLGRHSPTALMWHSLVEPSLTALKWEEDSLSCQCWNVMRDLKCFVGRVSWNISGYAIWCVCFFSSLEYMLIQIYKSMPIWNLFKTQRSTNLTLFCHQKLKSVVWNARLKPLNRLRCKRLFWWQRLSLSF